MGLAPGFVGGKKEKGSKDWTNKRAVVPFAEYLGNIEEYLGKIQFGRNQELTYTIM